MKPTGFSRWKEPKRWCKGAVLWSLVAEKKWRRRTVASRGWGIWRGRRLNGSCREWKCGCITQTEQGEGLKVNGLLAFGCDERKGWCRGFGFRMKMEETQMSNPPEKSQTVGRDLQRKVGALSKRQCFWRKGKSDLAFFRSDYQNFPPPQLDKIPIQFGFDLIQFFCF